MKLTITQGLRKNREWKVGEFFTWKDGLYRISVINDLLTVMVIVAATDGTPAGASTFFNKNDSDLRLVTELTATVE